MHREARISNYILIAFSVVALTVLSLPLSGPVRAFKAGLAYVLDPAAFYGAQGTQRLAGVPGHVGRLLAADVENRLMQEELRKSLWLKAEAEALRLENERLRLALALKSPGRRRPLWARVMERDPLHWYRSLMVDAGEEMGVSLNAPVLGQKGDRLVAIGRVVEVRPKTAVILLLTDELSSVAAYLTSPEPFAAAAPADAAAPGAAEASTAAVVSPSTAAAQVPAVPRKSLEGLLQGQGSFRLRMNYLTPDAVLEKGDQVYTSATSATFPPDILVGKVARVYPLDPFLTFQSVEVEPALDASQLTEVMILYPSQETPAASNGVSAVAPQAAARPPAPREKP